LVVGGGESVGRVFESVNLVLPLLTEGIPQPQLFFPVGYSIKFLSLQLCLAAILRSVQSAGTSFRYYFYYTYYFYLRKFWQKCWKLFHLLLLLHLLLLNSVESVGTSMENSSISTFAPPAEEVLLQEIDVMLLDETPQLLAKSGRTVVLPKSVHEALQCLVRLMVAGQSVSIVPQPQYLSCQQAAEILGCSRPHLYTLLNKGAIAYIKVGRHRRLQLADLVAYRMRQSSENQQSLMDLAALIKKLGIV
jgi:excisionase family DNA binding protein